MFNQDVKGRSVLIVKLIVGLLFFSLSGCASAPDVASDDSKVVVDVKKGENTVTEKETDISPEVMYLLLTAEIAGQRNRYGVALEGYLEAAKRVADVRVAERAAKIGLFLKDTKKTSEAVSIWLNQDEGNLTARKIALLSALKGGDKQLSVKHLNKMLADDPAGFEQTLLDLTRIMAKEGQADFVYNVLDEVVKEHPDQAVVFFVQGLLAGQLNKTELARKKVNQALKLQPDWDKALILHAQLYAQNRQYEISKADLEKVLEQSPDNFKVRKLLGQVLMKMNALDQAVAVYQKILQTEENDSESQFALALIYLQQKNEQDARVYLKKLVNKRGWDAQASFYLGRIAFNNAEYETALTWFAKVTEGPYKYEASMAAVSVLLEQGKFVGAETRLATLDDKFPQKKVDILLLKAEAFTKQQKYQQAFDVLSTGLDIFPEQRDLLYSRALIAEKIGGLPLLERDLKALLLKYPNDVAALNALGYTLVDRTVRYTEAEVYLQKALKFSPDNALIMDSMGWLRFKQGRLEDALLLLRAAYDKQAENEIAIHLAEVLHKLDANREAADIINKALKKTPKDEYLLKFRERFPEIR